MSRIENEIRWNPEPSSCPNQSRKEDTGLQMRSVCRPLCNRGGWRREWRRERCEREEGQQEKEMSEEEDKRDEGEGRGGETERKERGELVDG